MKSAPQAGRASLEWALNRLLDLDPQTRMRLAEYAGRRIELCLPGGACALRLLLETEGLRLEDAARNIDPGVEPDLRVEAAPVALLGFWLRSRGSAPPGAREYVQVSGDARLLSDLAAVLRDFRPDFEGALAPWVGDGATLQLLHWARALLEWLRGVLLKAARDGRERLRYEHGLLPGRPEVRNFLEEADRLRDAVEHLRLRLEALERRRAADS